MVGGYSQVAHTGVPNSSGPTLRLVQVRVEVPTLPVVVVVVVVEALTVHHRLVPGRYRIAAPVWMNSPKRPSLIHVTHCSVSAIEVLVVLSLIATFLRKRCHGTDEMTEFFSTLPLLSCHAHEAS